MTVFTASNLVSPKTFSPSSLSAAALIGGHFRLHHLGHVLLVEPVDLINRFPTQIRAAMMAPVLVPNTRSNNCQSGQPIMTVPEVAKEG